MVKQYIATTLLQLNSSLLYTHVCARTLCPANSMYIHVYYFTTLNVICTLRAGLKDIRSISISVATAVMLTAVREGIATDAEAIAQVQLQVALQAERIENGESPLRQHVTNSMYNPTYNPLVYVEPGVLE
jgi:hypothetical protein